MPEQARPPLVPVVSSKRDGERWLCVLACGHVVYRTGAHGVRPAPYRARCQECQKAPETKIEVVYGAMARAEALAAGESDWMNVTRWRTYNGRRVITDEEYDAMIAEHHAALESLGVSRDEVCNRCLSPMYDDRCYWPLRESEVP